MMPKGKLSNPDAMPLEISKQHHSHSPMDGAAGVGDDGTAIAPPRQSRSPDFDPSGLLYPTLLSLGPLPSPRHRPASARSRAHDQQRPRRGLTLSGGLEGIKLYVSESCVTGGCPVLGTQGHRVRPKKGPIDAGSAFKDTLRRSPTRSRPTSTDTQPGGQHVDGEEDGPRVDGMEATGAREGGHGRRRWNRPRPGGPGEPMERHKR